MRISRIAVLGVAVLVSLSAVHAENPEQLAADQQVLRMASIEIEDEPLLDYFKKRTLFDDDLPKVKEMVRKLGDEVFIERNRATNNLIAMGPTVRPMLREAIAGEDAEVIRRATNCLEAIDRNLKPELTMAAARMLVRRKPASATQALLNFLPFAEDEMVADEVRNALVGLALRDGKADPVLSEGTTDKLTVRRAAAVEALLRGKAIPTAEGRKFLADRELSVR